MNVRGSGVPEGRPTEPAGIRKWFVTMASTNDLKNGMVLNIEGQLWSVVVFQHVKTGMGPAFVRTKLKAVLSG
jgi:elongation factor P